MQKDMYVIRLLLLFLCMLLQMLTVNPKIFCACMVIRQSYRSIKDLEYLRRNLSPLHKNIMYIYSNGIEIMANYQSWMFRDLILAYCFWSSDFWTHFTNCEDLWKDTHFEESTFKKSASLHYAYGYLFYFEEKNNVNTLD
jgi:hypothetical protein